jgi:DNA repair ATPase RecN
MARAESEDIDAAAIREVVERAVGSLQETIKIKQQLTGATTSIANARSIVESLETQVRAYLTQVERLLDAAEQPD